NRPPAVQGSPPNGQPPPCMNPALMSAPWYHYQDEDSPGLDQGGFPRLTGEARAPELVHVSEKNLSEIENVHGYVSHSHISPLKPALVTRFDLAYPGTSLCWLVFCTASYGILSNRGSNREDGVPSVGDGHVRSVDPSVWELSAVSPPMTFLGGWHRWDSPGPARHGGSAPNLLSPPSDPRGPGGRFLEKCRSTEGLRGRSAPDTGGPGKRLLNLSLGSLRWPSMAAAAACRGKLNLSQKLLRRRWGGAGAPPQAGEVRTNGIMFTW
ncbi:hypothetical protein NHX12_010441, partial [Muraenolepis orangiensis]